MRNPAAATPALRSTSPPPAWPGFRQLTVTAITRESDSAISIRLEDPTGAPLPAARPGQYLTLRVQPDKRQRAVLRNYSLSGPPGAGYYRVTVKRERDGVASGYLHTRLAVGDQLDIAAPRGTFILDQTHAPVLLISAGIGATPVLAMLQALAQERSDREIWWLHGARNGREHPFAAEARALLASLPNARAHVYYSRPGPDDLEGRDFDSAGRLTASLLAELKPPSDAEAYLCGPDSLHGRHQRGSGRPGVRCLPHPHRTVRAGGEPDAGDRRDSRRGRPTHPPASPETARRSRSPAATSRSRGAATTAPCSNSPSPATYPSAGHAAPASARPARRRSSRGTSITAPTRLSLPPTEACSSAAHSPATTSCSISDRIVARWPNHPHPRADGQPAPNRRRARAHARLDPTGRWGRRDGHRGGFDRAVARRRGDTLARVTRDRGRNLDRARRAAPAAGRTRSCRLPGRCAHSGGPHCLRGHRRAWHSADVARVGVGGGGNAPDRPHPVRGGAAGRCWPAGSHRPWACHCCWRSPSNHSPCLLPRSRRRSPRAGS